MYNFEKQFWYFEKSTKYSRKLEYYRFVNVPTDF